MPSEALDALCRYGWPGNVRELYNHAQRMVALADPHLQPSRVPSSPGLSTEPNLEQPFRQAKDQAVRGFEERYLSKLLERSDGNISQAARLGAMDRAHLYKLLRKCGLI